VLFDSINSPHPSFSVVLLRAGTLSAMSGSWFRSLGTRLPKFIPRPGLSDVVLTIKMVAFGHLFMNSVAELRLCHGSSMLPTMSNDDWWILVSPLPYWAKWLPQKYGRPQRGDLVFAVSPRIPSQQICKRVIGIEGDLIEVEPRRGSGIRGWMRDDGTEVATKERKGEAQWVKVPKGYVWLGGDNMSNSTDSRDYGPVPLAMVKGKVLCCVSAEVSLCYCPRM
jgi:inner membrane protease subunit 1